MRASIALKIDGLTPQYIAEKATAGNNATMECSRPVQEWCRDGSNNATAITQREDVTVPGVLMDSGKNRSLGRHGRTPSYVRLS